MEPFSQADKEYCERYLSNLRMANVNIKTNADTAKARDNNVKKFTKHRTYALHGNKIKSPGSNVVASPELDNAVIAKFSSIAKPAGKTYPFEDNFLMFNRSGILMPSTVFKMPENGGRLNYSCHLGYGVDWSTVVAAAHTHPLYKDNNLNRLNKYFSSGDPSLLLARQLPLYLRTPKGKEIKVLEIREGWITTRRVDKVGSKPKKWVAKGS